MLTVLRLYNTLTRKIEEFKPLDSPKVGMYSCGPTVYDYPSIGNWRTMVLSDLLRRILEYNDYQVTSVMNATDVGHLSGDNLGDADVGEDRIEKGARKEGKTVWELAQFYLDDFLKTRDWLNIKPPTHFVRATEHIPEQIELVRKLLDKGPAYETKTGVFFDVSKQQSYGKLTGQKLTEKKIAVREEVEEDKNKRHPADFVLWFKTVGKFADHSMRWNSPWGEGFPGWHIECSAMSMKYLGESFDIHAGGIDLIPIHHTNEIAQSEGATGKQFVRFWVHSGFLLVDGGRMGKSLGNAYTLYDIKDKGFGPLSLRYLYLTAHYRTELNFTWQALEQAENSLNNLRDKVVRLQEKSQGENLKVDIGCAGYEQEFERAINDNLNIPEALAVTWRMVDDPEMKAKAILTSLFRFDKVLGLGLEKVSKIEKLEIPEEVLTLMMAREKLRIEKNFKESDALRGKIRKLGFDIEDTPQGPKAFKR